MEWDIQVRSEVCQSSGKPFQDEEEFFTLLFENPEGYRREDLCVEAFEQRPGDAEKPLSFWKSTFHPAPPPEQDAVNKDDAESELRRLMENRQPGDAKLCYLLALLLERKRILKSREKVQGADGRVVVYEHAVTGENFLVPEVDFKLSDLDALREEVSSGVSHIFAVAAKAPEGEPLADAPSGGDAPASDG